ncbi:MAG: InlB B-repeat-containing protein, partial [Clostridia bacterium]|nr:InlB B-repeat-containing protein [Clostridia bacterium]
LPGLNGIEYSGLESYYKAESVVNLKDYYESIDREYKNINQNLIDIGGEIYVELKGLIDELVRNANDADYTDVFYQILNIPTGTEGFSYPAPNAIRSNYSTWINWAKTNAGNISAQMDTAFLSVMYTDASVAALNRVLDGINWNLNIFSQDAVNGQDNATSYAKLVQNAREALTPRNYSVTYMVNDGTDTVYTVDKGHEYGSRIGSFPPSVPTRDKYVFKGWSSDPETLVPVSVEDRIYADTVIYAFWGSVYDEVIELVAGEGSATVIDKDRRYIYGLKPEMTRDELEGTFLNIIGNGRLVIEDNGSIGTGSVVKLVSNYTDDVLETYEVVIFGDLNGDGMINNSDVADLRMMNARLKNSTFNNPYTFAADIFADGDINNTDVSLLRMMNGRLATIDQATRERLS